LNEILFSIDKITRTYFQMMNRCLKVPSIWTSGMKRIFQWICGLTVLTTTVSHVAPLKIMAVIILQTAA